jgi:hypothetical protein
VQPSVGLMSWFGGGKKKEETPAPEPAATPEAEAPATEEGAGFFEQAWAKVGAPACGCARATLRVRRPSAQGTRAPARAASRVPSARGAPAPGSGAGTALDLASVQPRS